MSGRRECCGVVSHDHIANLIGGISVDAMPHATAKGCLRLLRKTRTRTMKEVVHVPNFGAAPMLEIRWRHR